MEQYTYGVVVNGKPLFIYAASLTEAKRKLLEDFKIDADTSGIPVDRL